MGLFTKTTKKIAISQDIKEVETLKVWSVTWKSASKGSSAIYPVSYKEFFTSMEDANSFANNIKEAYNILRYDYDNIQNSVEIKEENV